MNTNTSPPDMILAQEALAVAGIQATEVDHCTVEACSWCPGQPLVLAA
ncbi:MAG: hypothetical protein ACR2OI_10935 [Acidimicrobiia bacterium]